MKKLAIFGLFLTFSLSVLADRVPYAEALRKAESFAQSRQQTLAAGQPTTVRSIKKADGSDTAAPCYVFNMTNSAGFVMIASDDRLQEVLGYCDNGTFDADNLPDGLSALMQQWAQEVEWMEAHGMTREQVMSTQQNLPTTTVSPLVQTQWNQSSPYNLLCPTVSGKQAPTGCVATAMAQIINFHRYPTGNCAAVDAYTTRGGTAVSALPATTFAWSSMLNYYGSTATTAQRNAVAKLMQYCGSSVRMGYGANSSGAYSTDVPTALRQTFGYASSTQIISRATFSIAEYDAILTNELTHRRPIYLSASTTIGEGHAFVCDGRDSQAMYHINWGWGGYCDGYYRLSLLDAAGSGIGGSSSTSKWSFRQSAIIGISSTNATDITGLKSTSALTASRPSIRSTRTYTRTNTNYNFEDITVFFPINLYGNSDRVYYGLGLYQNGTLVQRLVYDSGDFYDTNLYGGWGSEELTFSFGQGLSNGTYEIKPIYYTDSRTWAKCINADRNYIKAEINNRNLELTVMPEGNFEVTDYKISGRWLIVDFVNPGAEYNGYIYLRNTSGTVIADEYVAVEAGAVDQVRLYVEDTANLLDDKDIFFLSSDYYNSEYFYSNGTSENANLTKSIAVVNTAEATNTVYGGRVYSNVTLTNSGRGNYHHILNTRLFVNGTSTPYKEERTIVDIPVGQTLTMPFVWELEEGDMNKSYYITATHMRGDEELVSRSSVFKTAAGVTMWKGNGEATSQPSAATVAVPEDVVAVDLTMANTENIVPNSNPNTVYLLSNSVPSSLTGKNIVASSRMTGTLNLYDGYDYYLPLDIQARKIYYHRTLDVTETGTYSTLLLPFTPAFVKDASNGNAAIDWYKGSETSGKDFWLQEITDINGAEATLANVENMEAFHPYVLVFPASMTGKEVVFGIENAGTTYTTVGVTLPSNYVSAQNGYTYTGTYAQTSVSNKYVLYRGQLVRIGENYAVPAFRVYLNGSNSADVITFKSSAVVTGIKTIDNHQSASDNAAWYTVDGQRLNSQPTQKGIYIHQGKKVVIK